MNNPLNLGDFLDRTGDPHKPLIIGLNADNVEHVFTREALDRMADAFARGLTRGRLSRGDRIAILSANRPEYVALVLGAMRAGIVPVPVNFKYAREQISAILKDCGAALVVCDAERQAKLDPAPLAGVKIASFDDEAGLSEWLDAGPYEPVVPTRGEAALSLYTSGSTGRPKGVLLSHDSHLWVARTRMAEHDLHDERVLIAAPLYHMNALALVLLVCASGGTAIMLPQFQAVRYIEAISRYRCTWLTAVPPMIAMMLREKEALARADLLHVRFVRMGSAPVNDTLVAQIRHLLPNARIVNAYGTTEGGPVVFSAHPSGLPIPVSSVGYPHPQVQVRLVGPDAPDQGVLQLKSPAVMLGYHNRPDIRSPITQDGFYETGDVFRRDKDGFFHFVGRTDDMFVSGGENIFPGEVEAVLETHPDVAQASVVPVDDDIKGTKPVAFVIRRPGTTVDEDALKRHVLAHAPAYQHPRRVFFIDQLPLAATNKIDRGVLGQWAREGMAQK